MRFWRTAVALLVATVTPLTLATAGGAFPRIEKTEALLYGNNLEPLGDNDAGRRRLARSGQLRHRGRARKRAGIRQGHQL